MAPTTRSSKRHATEGPLGTPKPSHLVTAPEVDTNAEFSTGCPDTPDSSEPDPKPTQKRARRAKKEKGTSAPVKTSKQVRVKGRLEVFKNVPVEVFIEITKYLHPFDLVLLSRVNKFFRELFMSRQATSIWVSARQSVPGLPPCPPELCEPQYAALLFTKMCSQCGKYAPRHMDPVLLVRLCAKCREEQYKLGLTLSANYKLPDSTLVACSLGSVPRHLRQYGHLRLSSEIEAVYSKLQELTAAEDQDAILRWKNERRKAVQDRYTNSQLYVKWFEARDAEREDDLKQRKDAHEAEVKARLISLGWEHEDHLPYLDPRRKQWLSLVRGSKVLTDRTWDKLLPQLLEHLHTNKKERLERERNTRENDRYRALRDFWSTAKNQLPSLLQATPRQSDMEVVSLPTTIPERNVLHQAFPSFSRAREWPEYTRLKDEDITGADLKLKLEGKQDSLHEFARKWRDQLEEALIKLIPYNADPADFNAPDLTLTSNASPLDSLPTDTKILLRADVVFKKHIYGSCNFYPSGFQEFNDSTGLSYDADSSVVATELLHALGRPEATYLEMRSLGRTFQCGRCIGFSELMAWEGLINHYTYQKRNWDNLSEGRIFRQAKEFPYIFTHDVKDEKPSKPLVRIAKGCDGPAASTYNPYGLRKTCLACRSAGIYVSFLDTNIKEHLHDVHLVEEPEEGKHFG
ncbi:unnamed protein product [Rhizoctonia solani]|uniref:F-box domain-containing protein n=1 Tax=Rhizoctonia solani TaxID=456999 RepID=A0A8H3CN80_9AGAM|nr:unnamed protein product [Rhizoctonia solani]